MAPARKPRGRYHHGDLGRALIDVAIKLSEKHGQAGWSYSQAARNLGVSTAAPYRHFKSRDELLDAVAVHGLEVLKAALLEAHASTRSPRRQFHAVAFALVQMAHEQRALFEITFSGARVDTLVTLGQAADDSTFGVLRAMVVGWQREGLLRSGDPVALAVIIWSSSHGVASLLASGRISVESPQSLCEAVSNALLDGIAA